MSDPRPAIFPSMDAPATTPAWLDANRAAKVRSLFEPEPEEEQGREQRPPSVAPGRDRRSELAPSIPPPAPPPTAAARRQVEHEPGADPGQTLDVPLDERALSRLPPPPGLGSLIPGARSAPPPANDTGYAVLREHAEAFANAAIELALARAATITVLEGQLLDLSIEIASALIERAVEHEPALHAALARAALSSLGDATAVTLRTSPDAFGPVCNVLGGEDSEVRGVRVHVVADSTIPGLGCLVDGENMRVDATVSERLRAVRRAFEEERRKTGGEQRMSRLITPAPAASGVESEINLRRYAPLAKKTGIPVVEGRLIEVVGLVLEAGGCRASIGDIYEVRSESGGPALEAEVVGLRKDRTLLMPLGETHGLEVGAPLRRVGQSAYVPVGQALLGRVVDGLGRPLDGRELPRLDAERPLHGTPRNPLRRRPIEHQFHVGVRAIDGFLTMGEGQRIGIFAGGGVGKSSLLGMMVRNASLDVAVIALIGERGREVEEFVHRTLGDHGLARSVVVAATSADPPLVRARGASYATAVAEYFRSRGLRVLLVMDSLTRYAMALREVGLAVGEPPATKGYTPTVFAALPRLLERAGTSAGPGSITGVYTVLVEGDDLSDPIADAVRAILDGHIVLSRNLAERGHFPAVDIPRSVSRVMNDVVSPERMRVSQRARELIATHREVEDLLAIGAYKRGSVDRLDYALERMPNLDAFLRQGSLESTSPTDLEAMLEQIWAGT